MLRNEYIRLLQIVVQIYANEVNFFFQICDSDYSFTFVPAIHFLLFFISQTKVTINITIINRVWFEYFFKDNNPA